MPPDELTRESARGWGLRRRGDGRWYGGTQLGDDVVVWGSPSGQGAGVWTTRAYAEAALAPVRGFLRGRGYSEADVDLVVELLPEGVWDGE